MCSRAIDIPAVDHCRVGGACRVDEAEFHQCRADFLVLNAAQQQRRVEMHCGHLRLPRGTIVAQLPLNRCQVQPGAGTQRAMRAQRVECRFRVDRILRPHQIVAQQLVHVVIVGKARQICAMQRRRLHPVAAPALGHRFDQQPLAGRQPIGK